MQNNRSNNNLVAFTNAITAVGPFFLVTDHTQIWKVAGWVRFVGVGYFKSQCAFDVVKKGWEQVHSKSRLRKLFDLHVCFLMLNCLLVRI